MDQQQTEKESYDVTVIEMYTEQINTDPYNVYQYLDRGNAYHDLKQYDLAIKDYKKAIDLDPRNSDAYLCRGNTYEVQEKYDQAIDDFSILIKLNPNNDQNYYRRGNAYRLYKNYPLAIKDLSKAIEINPKNEKAYVCRGKTNSWLRKYEQAIQDFSKSIELNPNNDETYVDRGFQYQNLYLYDLAIADYQKAIELNPVDNVMCNFNIGICRKYAGKDDNLIIENFSKIIEFDPSVINSYYHRGSKYYLQVGKAFAKCNKIDLAIQDFSKILELGKKVPDVYMLRAQLYLKNNELDLAINDYSIIMKEFNCSERYTAYFNRGCIYTIQKKFDLAIQDYLKLEENTIFSPLNQSNMGIISIVQQKYYKAILHLQEAFNYIKDQSIFSQTIIKENKQLIKEKILLLLEINKKLIEITELYEKQSKLNIITSEQDQNFIELQNNIANTILKEIQNNYKDDVNILKNLLNLLQQEILIFQNNSVNNNQVTNSVSNQDDIFDKKVIADTLELYKLPENENKLIYYKSFQPRLLTFTQACSLIQIDLFPQNPNAILQISKEQLEREIQVASFQICQQITQEELEPSKFQYQLIVSCIVEEEQLEKIEYSDNLYWQLGIDHSLKVLKFIEQELEQVIQQKNIQFRDIILRSLNPSIKQVKFDQDKTKQRC